MSETASWHRTPRGGRRAESRGSRPALEPVPDLVVEVLSPATRDNDLGPKRREYLDAAVRELSMVDPPDRSVLVADAAGERRLRATMSFDRRCYPASR